MKTVPLHGKKAAGRVALVDDADYELVAEFRWYVWEPPGHGPYAVAPIMSDRKWRGGIRMHKLITGWPMTDHKNHNGLDNQRSNLRPTTHSLNGANQRKTRGSSRFKGVTWRTDRDKWRAYLGLNGGGRHLGLFAVEEDAARAYDAAAREAFGEFACLNFPEEAP